MRKKVEAILCAVMLAASLAACGGSGQTSGKTESAAEATVEEAAEPAEEAAAEEAAEEPAAEEAATEEAAEEPAAEEAATEEAAAGQFIPGTYTATEQGFGGKVTVTITTDENAITSVAIEGPDETETVGGAALEPLGASIMEKQSEDIDMVAGATVTSTAVKTALGKALAQARGEAAEEASDGTLAMTAGTYESTVTGHNGDLTVKMEVSEDSILSIDTDNVESNGIGTAAIALLTQEIVDSQSLAVDSVSGATVTSSAFMSAVRDCISQAGGDAAVFEANPVAYPEKSEEPVEMTADVVIIGAGGAGFAAATEAVENGATVIIIEKNQIIGGNTARAGGTLNAPDPERQSKIGVEDSVELFVQNTLEAGDNVANPELVQVLCENALDARHWLSDHGTEWTEMVYQTIGGLWPRSMDEKDKCAFNGFIAPLAATVEENGGQVVLNCKADQILMDGDKAVGVHAVDTKNGQEYNFYANGGVIIATGGYSANGEMVSQYNGVSGLPTSNAPTSTGDGINLGLDAGAGLVGMEYIQIHPHGNPTTGGLQSHFAGVIKNSIYVNKEGNRFTEESGRRDVISNDTIAQTDQIMFSIYDSQGGFYTGVYELADLENLKSKGYIYQADTLEDLAAQAGIDPEGLVATVARYNELVEQGEDTDFHKDEVELTIGTAPFYCVPLSPTIHHTMGGLKINTEAQVLREDDSVIEGLWACGEVTGGIHGSNRVGGNALTDGVVFGRIAGSGAAAAAK